MLPFKFLFSMSLATGTLLAMTASHWILVWAGLELNVLSFIALAQHSHSNQPSEACTKYFVTQSMASLLFLVGGLLSMMSSTLFSASLPFMISAAIIKLGAAPVHFWVTPVLSSLSWEGLMIASTWQKLAPLCIFSNLIAWVSLSTPIMIALLSTTIGGLGGLGQTQLRTILAFSSIGHLGWMILLASLNKTMSLSYLVFYSMLLLPLTLTMNLMKSKLPSNNKPSMLSPSLIIMSIMLLSLGGLPPLSGFMIKWMAIQEMTNYISFAPLLIMLVGSLCNLYFYLKILYPSFIFVISPTYKSMATTPLASLPLSLLIISNTMIFMLM